MHQDEKYNFYLAMKVFNLNHADSVFSVIETKVKHDHSSLKVTLEFQ